MLLSLPHHECRSGVWENELQQMVLGPLRMARFELELVVHNQPRHYHLQDSDCVVSSRTGLTAIAESEVFLTELSSKMPIPLLRRGVPFAITPHWVKDFRFGCNFGINLVVNSYKPD